MAYSLAYQHLAFLAQALHNLGLIITHLEDDTMTLGILGKFQRAALLALLVVGGGAVSAEAATITMTTNFSFTGFAVPGNPATVAPYSTISGSVTVTFDPTAGASSGDVDAFSFASNVPLFSTTDVNFTYDPAVSAQSYGLDIHFGGQGVSFGTNDYLLRLGGLSSPFAQPVVGQFLYTIAGTGNIQFTSDNDTLSTTFATPTNPGPGTIPEPATLSLLALGGAATIAGRRRAS